MLYQVRDLELRAALFDVELAAGELEYFDPKLRQAGPLKAKGKIELVTGALGEIRVQGHVTVRMEADCDRCLEPAEMLVDSDFELYYRPAEDAYSEEKILDPAEAEIGFYEGSALELKDVLREYVLLALPMQRVCSETCQGICPVCGQNRNQVDCKCDTSAADDRWAALKQLK